MTKDVKIEQRDFIVKGNALVEARYRLGLQESQVILWLLTQIRSEDEDFKPHKLNITEFAQLLNLNPDGQYAKLQIITEKLMRRVLKIHDSEKQELLQVAWLSSAHYKSKQGYVLLEFSPKLKPYLLQLKTQFTKINIVDTLKLKSIYAIRVFELLLQYQTIGFREITIDNLRAYCGIEKQEYADYFDLKRKVIEKAKSEINSKTEYEINYKEIKESRKIISIEWTIKKKNLEKEERYRRISNLCQELRSESAVIESLIEYGYSKALAKRFIKDNSEDIVKKAVQAVDLQIERNNVRNPKAMIRTAISERWKPDVFKVKKK